MKIFERMKNNMINSKKLLSLFLALIMLISSITPVFAVDSTQPKGNAEQVEEALLKIKNNNKYFTEKAEQKDGKSFNVRILEEDFKDFDGLKELIKSSLREVAEISEIETMSFCETNEEPIWIGAERRLLATINLSKSLINQRIDGFFDVFNGNLIDKEIPLKIKKIMKLS